MNNDRDPAALGCNEELGQAPKRDIVERLRTRNGSPTGFGLGPVCDEAADEIVRLRARVLELEAVHEDASGAILEAVAAERERCIEACRGEFLVDAQPTEGDVNYTMAVSHCIAAILRA
jgi:hypothetical protein